MKRVTGIGGIFFKANDPAALRAWGTKSIWASTCSLGAARRLSGQTVLAKR
jgi:hypothetical protein